MLWAQRCLWLAQRPLLALTLTPRSKITFHKDSSIHVASKRVEGQMLHPLTPGQELFLHSSSAFTLPPPNTPVLPVAFLAGIATCIYSHYIMSQGKMP